MAKVKIQGHASGSGVLTVTAPNTSTDRTITLPDATGTLLNSDGSGASLTALNATNLGSGTVPTARLGSGTASSSTFLRGDSTYAAAGATGLDDVGGVARATSGLLFGSDTAAVNTLDDYEEGTFTMTVQDWSSAGFSIGTVAAAKYTKVGNAVTIWFKAQLVCDSGSPGGGDLRFNGWPFGTAAGAQIYVDVIFGSLTTNQTNMRLSFYGSGAYLYALNSSGNLVDMTASLGGNTEMSISFTYMTN